MSNHYHLLVQTPDASLPEGMRQLNGVYTQRINKVHGRAGHVFQGCYKAILVQKEAYLLELACYVVLNPVRARMLRRAGDWPLMMVKRQQIIGSVLRPRPVAEKAAIVAELTNSVLPLLAERKLVPLIYKVYGLEDVAQAHRDMEASVHFGKIVLAVKTLPST
jgi:hypothetical protein